MGEEKAEGLIFRFALEASAAAGVERIVFLALRGEEGQVECFWPVSLDVPSTGITSPEPAQLRLLGDEAFGCSQRTMQYRLVDDGSLPCRQGRAVRVKRRWM